MNELIMRALSYVDDRWITEAMSDYETVKMKHFFQKERRKKYLCTAVCIAAAAFILSISLIWSIVHKYEQSSGQSSFMPYIGGNTIRIGVLAGNKV